MVRSEPSTNARRSLRQVAIALVFSALTVASACTAPVDEAPPTAESTSPTVAGATPARPLPTPTPVLAPASATPTATPTATPAATSLVIVATDGDGVAVRDACDDARRTSAPGQGLAEDTTVLLLARGEAACIGWMLIQAPDRRESWVRTRYLAASPLDSSASQPATPPPPPTPARGSTQTPTVTPQPTRAPVATRTPTTALEPTAASIDGWWQRLPWPVNQPRTEGQGCGLVAALQDVDQTGTNADLDRAFGSEGTIAIILRCATEVDW